MTDTTSAPNPVPAPEPHRWAEAVLALVAALIFLTALGSPDLWGKREQRSAAEALDTWEHSHWIIANIQCRQRLEKPPLPRWIIAGLFASTGQVREWVVRLPNAICALGMIALTYDLARRMGGRLLGLTAGFFLATTTFFIIELRQAGNDGMLSFFITLAIYCAWRRLHPQTPPKPTLLGWSFGLWLALGFGFMCKGPIVLLITGMTVGLYLIVTKQLKANAPTLLHPLGILVFLVMAAIWPVMVIMTEPKAIEVWYLEMAMKAGSAGVGNSEKSRAILLTEWPAMTIPWIVPATAALALPFFKRRRESFGSAIWFVWIWTVANLVMFCFWRVAKSNYFLPCMSGMTILASMEWLMAARRARESLAEQTKTTEVRLALISQWFHWLIFPCLGLGGLIFAWLKYPEFLIHASIFIATAIVSSLIAKYSWKRGYDLQGLTGVVAPIVVFTLIAYVFVMPTLNPKRSYRSLAEKLDQLLPPPAQEPMVMFFHELDEGLWFYLKNRNIQAIPNSQPRFNDAFDLQDKFRDREPTKAERAETERERIRNSKKLLLEWLASPSRTSSHVLIRAKDLDLYLMDREFRKDLETLATEIHRESDLDRTEVVVLRAKPIEQLIPPGNRMRMPVQLGLQ